MKVGRWDIKTVWERCINKCWTSVNGVTYYVSCLPSPQATLALKNAKNLEAE